MSIPSKIPTHGGYRNLKSFQNSEIIYDFTVEFCKQYIDKTYGTNRTHDQMVQAARSGKQNIAEGSQVSGVAPKNEVFLMNVARASLQELLEDYRDFLRQHNLPQWDKDDSRAIKIRQLAYEPDRTYTTYMTYLSNPESAANCLMCLINQTNYLLDRQLQSIRAQHEESGVIFESRNQRATHLLRESEKYEAETDMFIAEILKKQKEGNDAV